MVFYNCAEIILRVSKFEAFKSQLGLALFEVGVKHVADSLFE